MNGFLFVACMFYAGDRNGTDRAAIMRYCLILVARATLSQAQLVGLILGTVAERNNSLMSKRPLVSKSHLGQ
jgi:hypothetical protein